MAHNMAFFVVGLMALSALTRLECLPANVGLGTIAEQQRLSPGYQCKALGYDGNCKSLNDFYATLACTHLICARRVGDEYMHVTATPAVDDTPCGPNRVCKNGHCLTVLPYEYPFIGLYDEFVCTR